jgi:hypothetical protein
MEVTKMRKALVVLTACMLVLGVSMAMARPSEDAKRFVIPPFASENPRLQQSGMNTFQAGDTFWFGPWDFETGGGCLHDDSNVPLGLPGDATSQGWTSEDETAQGVWFHRTDGSALDPGPVLEGSWSMWCGWLDLCPSPPALFNSGYANSMQQQVYKTYEFGPTPGNMTYLYYSDSEPGYDYTYLIATTTHDPLTCGDVDGDTLVVYNGAMGYGFETVDLSAYANQTVTLVFKFQSDGGWSDADGLYSTGGIGAFSFDSCIVAGDYDDFEADDNGWQMCAFQGYGDYAGIYSLSNLDVQDPTCTCLEGCVLAFFDRDVIPHEHPMGQVNIAVSPTLNLTNDANWPRGNSLIQWGWYRDLPLAADNFAIWHVRYQPIEDDDCNFCDKWSPWFDENTVYYGPQPNCGVANFNVSGQVRGHAEILQIAVGIQNMCLVWPWWCVQPGNESPIFDNIRFGMHGERAPGMFASDWDFFQDAFALDGELNPRSTGRIDSGTNIFPLTGGVQVHTVLGDTAVVNTGSACPSRLPQGLQNPDAYMNLYFRVWPGECIDATAYGAWYGSFPMAGGWAYARMDTAKGTAPSPTVEGVYMTRFHETDPHFNPVGDNDILPDFLFTPGTTIEYFYTSYWAPTPGAYNVYPDTTGGFYQEVEILPDIMNPQINCDLEIGPDDQNCMLWVDHWDRRGAQDEIERGFHALGLGPVVEDNNFWHQLQLYDRYDNEAPTSDQGGSLGGRICQDVNHPAEGGVRANGPTLTQIINYYTILWAAGNQETVMFGFGGSGNCANDIALLQNWMDFPRQEPVLFWLSATGPGVFMFVYGDPTTAAFGSTYLGIDLVAASYRDYTGDYSDCPTITPTPGLVYNSECGVQQTVNGACGDFQYNFNVLTTEATTQGAVGELLFPVAGGPNEYAAVSHDALLDTATVSLYKTVTDALGINYMRKYEPYCDSDVCVAWYEADVIGNPLFYDYCYGNLQLVADRGEYNPRFANRLGNSYPNPMNPSVRIDFSIKTTDRVTLRVFDVSGRLVTTLLDRKMDAGNHFVVWDGTNSAGQKVASGIYFYQIDSNGFKAAKKITVLK